MITQSRDDLDALLRPVLSGLPPVALLLREIVTAPGTKRPFDQLSRRSDTLDEARARTLAQVTRMPAGDRGDTIRVVQAAAIAVRQMLAVARVAAYGTTGHIPDRCLRSSRTVVQLSEQVVTVGLVSPDATSPDADVAVRTRPLADPLDPQGTRRRLVRYQYGARELAGARLADAATALSDLSAELDVMMGHLIIPVQWRFRPVPEVPAARQPTGAAGEYPQARPSNW